MDYIGVVTPKIWETAQKLAEVQEFPIKQIPHCPYIILKQINQKQLLALTGHFSKQQIHLYTLEVCSPNISPKDRVPIIQADWDKAHDLAQELLTQTLSHNSHRSSIPNQPNKNQP